MDSTIRRTRVSREGPVVSGCVRLHRGALVTNEIFVDVRRVSCPEGYRFWMGDGMIRRCPRRTSFFGLSVVWIGGSRIVFKRGLEFFKYLIERVVDPGVQIVVGSGVLFLGVDDQVVESGVREGLDG